MKFLVTADNNGAIGRGAQPLVTIPAMQQSFLKETQGKVVVMGRKTLEGLPGGQPLGNRVNVVLSENPAYKIKGAVVCHNIDEALEYLKQFSSEDIYVIGGESIFRQFLPYCNTVYLTHIDYEYDADVKFSCKFMEIPGMGDGGRRRRTDLFQSVLYTGNFVRKAGLM